MGRSVDVRVQGARELRRAARQLRMEAKHLPGELRDKVKQALDIIPPAVREETAILPSGYAPLLAASLRFTKRVNTGVNAAVSMTVRGVGKVEQRDVRAINLGLLRHPTFGHRSRWVGQRVRMGFIDKPFERAAPVIRDRISEAIEEMLRRLARG